MAYLILNEKESYTDDTEKYYEFDSKDKTSIVRIHQILALRKKGITINSEKLLSDICEHTLNTAEETEKTFFSLLFKTVKKHLAYLKTNISKAPVNKNQTLNSYTCHLCGARISCSRG